jgi:hypothetical protein
MLKRKVIAVIFILVSALAVFCWVELSKRPVLTWKVVDVRPHQYYFAVDHMQDCWRVDIEVSNMTASEVIVDWNRDKSSFQVSGQWEDLGIAALMPYLAPNESLTFPVYVPQQAQACRVVMYYEHGPLWSRADQFLRNHDINLPDNLFALGMNFNKKLPGHYKQLVIEVKLPATTAPNATSRQTQASGEQWDFLPRLERISESGNARTDANHCAALWDQIGCPK